jgi:ABC-type antimicrobial peptide transport system permease subunit
MGGAPSGVPADAFLNRQTFIEGMRSSMNTLLIIAGVIAIILLLVGGFNQALSFLLWVGIILLVLALIGWVLGRGRSRV